VLWSSTSGCISHLSFLLVIALPSKYCTSINHTASNLIIMIDTRMR
jgi:hypothetical protein